MVAVVVKQSFGRLNLRLVGVESVNFITSLVEENNWIQRDKLMPPIQQDALTVPGPEMGLSFFAGSWQHDRDALTKVCRT